MFAGGNVTPTVENMVPGVSCHVYWRGQKGALHVSTKQERCRDAKLTHCLLQVKYTRVRK